MQGLRVLREMKQGKAFMSLLAASLADSHKVNDKAQAAHMSTLSLGLHIEAGNLPAAWLVGQQVLYATLFLAKTQW